MLYKTTEKRRIRALKRYYAKRKEILEYQRKRLKKKYKEDPEFRKKRQLRDKSRVGKKAIIGECNVCGSKEDLQRHHPSYDDVTFVILCRKCHTHLHLWINSFSSVSGNLLS